MCIAVFVLGGLWRTWPVSDVLWRLPGVVRCGGRAAGVLYLARHYVRQGHARLDSDNPRPRKFTPTDDVRSPCWFKLTGKAPPKGKYRMEARAARRRAFPDYQR